MAMKKSRPAEQLRAQANQEQKISRKADKPTAANGAYQASKGMAFNWAKGGIFTPDEAQPAWFQPGSRAFSEMVAQNPEPFKRWDQLFTENTDAGFAFRPPPPEPEKPMAGGGNKEMA